MSSHFYFKLPMTVSLTLYQQLPNAHIGNNTSPLNQTRMFKLHIHPHNTSALIIPHRLLTQYVANGTVRVNLHPCRAVTPQYTSTCIYHKCTIPATPHPFRFMWLYAPFTPPFTPFAYLAGNLKSSWFFSKEHFNITLITLRLNLATFIDINAISISQVRSCITVPTGAVVKRLINTN